MQGAIELLDNPETAQAVVSATIVLLHACAGAGALLVVASPKPEDREWHGADRLLLIISFALGLPLVATAALVLAVTSRDAVRVAHQAFSPLLVASAAIPLLWLVAWTVRCATRSTRVARAAGWFAMAMASAGIVAGAIVAAWTFDPAGWIESRALRSAVTSWWILPMLLLRSAAAIALGGAGLWALVAPLLAPGAARKTVAGPSIAALVTALCIAALCAAFSAGGFQNAWLGVPALAGPHGARATRLLFVALAASSFAAAIAWWAMRAAVHHRFAPAGATALCVIALFCFEQARATAIRPWALPGHLYANGTTVEHAQVHRRSPRIDAPAGASSEAIGAAMFKLQCSVCHDVARSRSRSSERGFPETRTLLERLRETDQAGNPWLGVMPPLVGSDQEIDALARWMCGRP